ncbi:MAG: flippase-like domain-containing protein [Proteobacteria bacterium]|nr:flippase-like domain-containing protein [Pseudomonadota bacterium]
MSTVPVHIDRTTRFIPVKQLMGLSKKAIFIGLFSLIYIGAIIYLVDLGDVISVLGRIPGTTLATASALVIIANLLALARTGAVLKALGFRSGWRDLFLAFSAGNVSGLPLNVVGQSLTRAMVLARAGIPFSVTVIATYIERFLAAGLLFIFSLVGLWFLFGAIDFDFQRGGREILFTIGGIAIVGGVVGLTVFRGQLIERSALCLRWVLKLWASGVLTILIHGAGLGAYLVLLSDLGPHSISTSLVAALIIVMFVSSLPISFAGWGLRELSAASTLSLIGISPEVAVAAAIAIGLLYLAATGLFGALSLFLLARKRQDAPATLQEQDSTPVQTGASIGQDWDAKIVQGCAIICAILLFFRVPTQLANSEFLINVNVADVIVFIALSVIVLMIAAGRIRSLFPPFLTITLTGLTAVIGVGLMISYAQNNLGNWALYTRGLGWVLMLGYTALGAVMVTVAGNSGRMLIVRTLIAAAITICVIQLLLLAWSVFVFPVPGYGLASSFVGFANNRNAFSFELVMIGILLVVGRNVGFFEERQWFFTAAVAVLTLTIYFTGSRTGAVFVVVLALLDNLLVRRWAGDRSDPRSRATLLAAIAIVAAILMPYIVYFAALILETALGIELNSDAVFVTLAELDKLGVTRLLHPSSDIERWETIVGGLRLWIDSPLLGAGLGAYVEWARAAGLKAQGIHSVYIWFLAEMGILGLGVVMGLAVLIAIRAWRMMATPSSTPWGFTMVGILAVMAVGGLVQNFFYQRIFWFLLGLTAAVDSAGIKETSNARIFLIVVVAFGLIVFFLAL